MTLQFLVPQYKETKDVIKPLLDSIAIQQNVDMNDIGVIICNDGSDVILPDEFLMSYPFRIDYYKCEHRGVSATRNECLDKAEAEYVMFCDADDMFINACALFMIFNEIKVNGGFDSLTSAFNEEIRDPITNTPNYIVREVDSTFVHGKVHRLQYLIDRNIRWNDKLTIHEDSYFNILCQKLSDRVKYCPFPFYLWRWRDDSVCRHDEKYILKTFNNMLDSNTELVNQFLSRGLESIAQEYVTMMIYDSYFTLNKSEWINQENQSYRRTVEVRFKEYYETYKDIYKKTPGMKRDQIIMGLKNRMFEEGLVMESITFNDWIKSIENMEV